MKDVHKSLGGGKMKEGTLITSTKSSHRSKSAAKKISGSMMFFRAGFTITDPLPTLEERRDAVKEWGKSLRELIHSQQHYPRA
jgi:hypothetical protein